MKRFSKALLCIVMSLLFLVNSLVPTLPTITVFAAATDMDASNKSTVNPPQSIVGKTDIATWSYTAPFTNPDLEASSGYYQNTPDGTKSTLQLFKNNVKFTGAYSSSGGTFSTNGFNGSTDKGYWLIKTSTKGFKDLVFDFVTRSSGTGPRDFNTEWSIDGVNWNIFGNATASTGYSVKIESTSPAEQFGMVLPAGAANQDTLYIRIIQKSEVSEGGGTIGASGTHGINSIQLYGSKDPLFTTPNVTASPDATGAILDVTPISLTCADQSAQIYYTTDGSTPAISVSGSAISVSGAAITVTGTTKAYTGPFTVYSQGGFSGSNPFVVKAIALSLPLLTSDVQTFSFTQQTITSNSDAKNLDVGTYVWVKGVGTYLNGNATLYIQDGMSPGSGLCIYKAGANFSAYVGKEIYVYGKASPYYGLMEIVPDTVDSTNIVVRNDNPTLPTPTKIMLSQISDRTYEGMLVSLDTIKLDNVAGTTTTSYYNHTISQGGAPFILRAKGIAAAVGTAGSYVNITQAIVNYSTLSPFNGAYLLSANTSELVQAATPTVGFLTAGVAGGASIPLNSAVTLTTATVGATITYSINGGAPVTSAGNSVDVTVDAFVNGVATIAATASDGTYTTATQTFTYTQSQAADVTANPSSLSISATTPITLASATVGAQVVYSLYKNSYSDSDGTPVGTVNQAYTGPITLDSSYFPIRIVAKATLTNYLDSNLSTFKYTAQKTTGGEKNYYGEIHAHTAENSDGQGTLAEANAYARDVGKLDFFILTDHSNSIDKAAASDSLATIKDLNSYNTTNQQWINGKVEAAKATTDTFLCDYAYEMTWSGGPGHINTFNTAGFVSRNNTVLNSKANDAGMQAYYQLIKNTPGSISQFNHPGATFGNFSDFAYYDPVLDDRINLIEVGNGEGAVGSGGYFPSIDQYILALDKGWHLAPTNNGDNHKKGWGTSNTCATVVYTNDFTLSGIYQAMQDRSVWATENRDLDVTYHLTDGTSTYSMGAILDSAPAAADITITAKNKNPQTATSNIASIQLISNGGKVVDKQIYSAGSSDITYTYSMTAPESGYYFAIITDNNGFKAVTAPIWLGSAPKVGITSVASSSVMPVTTEALSLTTTLFNNESTPAALKSISYTVAGDPDASNTFTPGASIASAGSTKHVFSYTPATPGTKTVTINAVITVNGVDLNCSTSTTMKVVDIDTVSYVGLDASHGNEYVSGGSYPNSMANMMILAAKNGLRVVQLNTSEEFINACNNPKYKMMILNAPSRKSVTTWPNPANYTDAEIAALKTFAENGNTLVFGVIADYAESSNKDAATPKKHMAELQNDVLAAIGSTLREGDDEVMDDDKNGGQPYRLYPTEFNLSNPLLQGVISGQTYSQYSGATIYAVDPVTGERTATLPSTVSALVYGFPTTYSAECDSDNFGYGTAKDPFPFVTVGTYKTDKGMYNANGIYIPKYVNPNSNVAANPEEKLLAASEYVQHSNGNTSLVVVAGGSFMSNFEIAVTMDNAATLPYVNYNIMDNLYKTVNPEIITSIADAKNLPDGTEVIIEGTATSEINTQSTDTNTNKGFFDCIYAQDATGGINLFPVAAGIMEGQKARFYGKISHFQGEVELTVTKFTILDQTINKIEPATVSTSVSMNPSNTGALVKTSGVVSNVLKDVDGTINQFTINDGSGSAIIFINGYITKGTTLPFIKDGATVSVIGLASIGEVVSDSDMHPRIRVRDRAEIVDLTADVVNTAIVNLPAANNVKLTDEAAINAANSAYNTLSTAQNSLITAENKQKLADVVAKLAQLKAAAENPSGGNTSDDKAAADKAAAAAVSAAIEKLPAAINVQLTDEASINAAKEAYNALTADQKLLVSSADKQKLTDVTARLDILKNPYKIVFSTDGSKVATKTLIKGSRIDASPVTTKTGYTFDGWYIGSNKVTFPYIVNGNATFTAHWTINTYTVSFDSNGGTKVAAVKAVYNTAISTPVAPSRKGQTFAGWYANSECTKAWSFGSDKVVTNTTLYAKWSKNPVTPKTVKTTKAAQGVKVSWSSVSEATKYEVYRATSSNGKYTLIATTSGTSFTDTGITKGKTYYYKIREYKMVNNQKVYSDYTKTVTIKY
ncbi:MAG TPA: InlB B-repeat-containing protein [Mobilitalea sp.]|nr:InlB B-repeat-containing protein [Mobilitalea sp.]